MNGSMSRRNLKNTIGGMAVCSWTRCGRDYTTILNTSSNMSSRFSRSGECCRMT